MVESYRDLDVWKRAMTLAKEAYRLTTSLPKEELYGLISQIRRAASSIPANIAEGWGRKYPAEFIQFLRKANGSRTELETHLLLAAEIQLCRMEQIDLLLRELEILGKQILSLERSLARRTKT